MKPFDDLLLKAETQFLEVLLRFLELFSLIQKF
jgi:hypothetical protein